MVDPPVESRQLAAFGRACSRGGRESLERNWTKLTQKGLPLIERIPGDREMLSVTFVWRPGRPTRAPSVYTPVANFAQGETALRPLGNSGVWYRSFRLPRGTRAMYGFSHRTLPALDGGEKAWLPYLYSRQPDPFNPRHIVFDRDPDDPEDRVLTFSVVELPGALPQPWSRTGGPSRWKEEHHRIRSRFLRNTRSVWVYLPPDFDPKEVRYRLVVALDGLSYRSAVPTPRIVENLVAAGRIPPAVVVLVGNALHARFKDLGHNPAFSDFLARELLPWLHRRYRLRTEPSTTVLAGSSLGAVASAYAALQYPQRFGNVLAQSGAFQLSEWGPGRPAASLMQEFAHAPKLPLRFYLDAGKLEGDVSPGMATSLLGSVRHMRDVLEAKGYPVTYAEFDGGHDYSCWSGTLADGIFHLLGRA